MRLTLFLLVAPLALSVLASPTSARADDTPAAEPSGPTLGPNPPAAPKHSVWPWVVAGVGGGTAAVGILSFVGAVKAWSDVSSEAAAKHCSTSPIVCPPGVDSSNIQRNQTGGQAMDIIGVSFTAVGGAALVAGITWHYLEPTKPLPTGTARFSVAPWVGRGGGVLLQGSF